MAQSYPVRIYFGEFSAINFYAEPGADSQFFSNFLTGIRVGDLYTHYRRPCGPLGNIPGWDEYIDLDTAGIDFVTAENLSVFEDIAGVELLQQWLSSDEVKNVPTNVITIEANIADWFKYTHRSSRPSPNENIANPQIQVNWQYGEGENKPYDTYIEFAVAFKDTTTIEQEVSLGLSGTWSVGNSGGVYWLNIEENGISEYSISIGDVIEQNGARWHIYALDTSSNPNKLYYDPTEGGTQAAQYISGGGGNPKVFRIIYGQSDPVYCQAGVNSANPLLLSGHPYPHTLVIENPNNFPVQAWLYAAYQTRINKRILNQDFHRAWLFGETHPTCYVWIDANSSTTVTTRFLEYAGSNTLGYIKYPSMENSQTGIIIESAINDVSARLAYAFRRREEFNTSTGEMAQALLIINYETQTYYKGVLKGLSNTFLAGFGKRTEDSAQIIVQIIEEGIVDNLTWEFPESVHLGYGTIRDSSGRLVEFVKPEDGSSYNQLYITDSVILRALSEEYYVYNKTTNTRGEITEINTHTGVVTFSGSVIAGNTVCIQAKSSLSKV
jgi:hypothetical protein